MAFSRYRRTTRRPNRFRAGFRRANRLSTVHRPIRWERGNFYLTFLHSHIDDERLINTVVPIATINNLITDASDAGGRRLAEMQRALEIGGIKFTLVQKLVSLGTRVELQNTQDFGAASALDTMECKALLVSDGMVTDPADGLAFPQAIDTNFFTNTQPVARTQEVQDVQSLFPRRIHWQNYKHFDAGFPFIYDQNTGETQDEHPYGAHQQAVVSTHSTSNLRLRLRLQDDECLSWFFTSFINDPVNISRGGEVQFRCTGTIWYRYR